ncbi:MAG: D-alanyl-D-alanine dipeptidase [Ignavibacteria bacterium RBG_16_34_14]|nr:MAG: D-alanyl-D-alanine dipeptidase [Ignavibacteria bacterium RBG_16_34_14]
MNGIIYKNILLILLLFITSNAQQINLNEYGLYVVDNAETYLAIAGKDSNKLLVDIEKYIPNIMLDIRYATDNNFVGEPVYNIPKAFTRLPVAKALRKIQYELMKENLGLKIYDAYRPYSVTVKFFKKVKDTNFVASPKKGSRHNRGCAVDITVIDLKTGKEIEMPTPYDDFTEKASQNFNDLPKNVINNREKLKRIMTENGFKVFATEWWHFDFKGWENYELMDISFEELIGLEKIKK